MKSELSNALPNLTEVIFRSCDKFCWRGCVQDVSWDLEILLTVSDLLLPTVCSLDIWLSLEWIIFSEPQAGIDPRCPRANGIFDHEDKDECHKFYLCDKGTAHEMPCVSSLVFDVAIGSCVRPTETSEEAKKCGGGINGEPAGLKTIEGFTCPGKETIGPQGLLQAHPVFPHPTDCQFFFTCFFGKDPNKFGCSKGQVFDALSLTCKDPLDVPECSCWYDCGENSNCPGTCQADCSCPVE